MIKDKELQQLVFGSSQHREDRLQPGAIGSGEVRLAFGKKATSRAHDSNYVQVMNDGRFIGYIKKL